MPANFQLFEKYGLAYVKFWDHVSMEEVAACAERFANEPGSDAAYRHLVDFSGVTSYDSNYVKIIEMQAKLADVFDGDANQWIFAYYAPKKVGREMANYGIRAWDNVEKVVIRMTMTESDTFDVLGLGDVSFASISEGVAPN